MPSRVHTNFLNNRGRNGPQSITLRISRILVASVLPQHSKVEGSLIRIEQLESILMILLNGHLRLQLMHRFRRTIDYFYQHRLQVLARLHEI
jgi:hypothetical protein